MQFLQPTQSEAYAKKTRFPHKLSGSEQLNPFGHSLRGAVAKHEPKQNKQASWTKPRDCLRLLLCSFLGFEPTSTIQLDCNNCLNVQDPKIFLKKLSSTNQRQATSTLRSLMPPSFFRPTPSWLPPGRSTCLRACCNWD